MTKVKTISDIASEKREGDNSTFEFDKQQKSILAERKEEAVKNEIASDEFIVNEFKTNPEVRKGSLDIAHDIKLSFPNWFTVNQIVKKFKEDVPSAARKIEVLMLLELCVGKVEKGKPLFKIDLDKKVQKILLKEKIAEKEGELLFLKEKLVNLN